MSQFSRELQLGRFSLRKPLTPLSDMLSVNEEVCKQNLILYEYRVRAIFSLKLYARDNEEAEHLLSKAKEAMIYAMFGEFKSPLYKLWEALANRDCELAMTRLRELEREMFT